MAYNAIETMMNKKNLRSHFFMLGISIVIFFLSGCYKATPPIVSSSEAYQKFEQTCVAEINPKAIITSLKNTLYIFLPIQFDIVELKASGMNSDTTLPQQHKQLIINFFQSDADKSTIMINYDIGTINSYPTPPVGYGLIQNDEFSNVYQSIFNVLFESFSDINDNEAPAFINLIVMNTKTGVGMESLLAFSDLKKSMSQSLAPDEFMMRVISKYFGNENAISDLKGKWIDYHDYTWMEFITKQITHRGKNYFPGTGNDIKDVLSIVNDAITAYDFKNFEKVRLENLADGKVMLFNKEQLASFGSGI